jgi:uncharacterized membrane protein
MSRKHYHVLAIVTLTVLITYLLIKPQLTRKDNNYGKENIS